MLPQGILRSRRYLFRAAILTVLIGLFVSPALISAGSGTFSNSTGITVQDGFAADPSNITVTGLSGVITEVAVSINGLYHNRPDDFDIALVGPNSVGGESTVMLMSDAGGDANILQASAITLTFRDGFPLLTNSIPEADPPLATGTYGPTNYTAASTNEPLGDFGGDTTRFPGGFGTSLAAAFNGADPNGVWKLYVYDDIATTAGGITSGWSITITTNDAPTALDDVATTNENTAIPIDVLANDTDPQGDTLTPYVVTNPANGTAVVTGNQITYTPNAGFSGSDSFTYHVFDGFSYSATATVSVTVNAVNVAPVAGDDFYNATAGVALNVAAPGVLANDSDGDSDPLTLALVTGPANGTLILNADGSFSYTANGAFVGDDTFTYVVNDGTTNSNTATVTISVVAGNAAPTVSAGADLSGTVGIPVNITASYTDPNVGDTHTATIDWGDGSTDTPAAAGGSVSGSHTYATAGSYTITVTVTDNSSAAGSDTVIATITDVAQPTATAVAPTATTVAPTEAPYVHPTATPIPLLTDYNGVTINGDAMLANVPLEIRYGIFARMIVENGRYVRRTNPGMIGHQGLLDLDVRHAVDITVVPGLDMSAGVRLCFEGRGTAFFLDAAGAPRVPVHLNSTREDGRTCVYIFTPGTVVVTRNDVQAEPTNTGALVDCEITTVYRLNLRSEAAMGDNILVIIPDGVTLAALDQTDDWFRVSYQGFDGWVAREFVSVSESCAGA